MDDPLPERLATKDLFTSRTGRIHVNHPLHEGDTPLHDHDFVEIALVADGRAVHRELGAVQPAEQGDVVVVLPGHWHAWEHCRGLRLYNVCFTSGLLQRELAWLRDDPSLGRLWTQGVVRFHLPPADRQQAQALAERLRQHNHRPAAGVDLARAVADLLAWLAWLAPHAPVGRGSARQDSLVAELVHSMADDLAHNWGLVELAERVGLDTSHLGRRFRRVMGRPPMAWLARRRCERAAVRLLTSDDPVAAIGAEVGFSDANYFARRFRQEMGQSPRAYRQQLPMPPAVPSGADWIQW